MPEPKRPLKVFLSYSSQDRPLVRELSRRLVGEGWIDTWLDEKSLLPGQDWRVKIEEAVEESDIVIICLSTHSVTKEGYVQKELRYAREIALEKPEDSIFLIPLRLDECEVPRGLRFYQWVDYFGERKTEAYNALVESLKLRHEQKLRLEEAERARKEKLQRECEAAERVAREKAKREAAKRLAQEKAAREKAEKEIAEKTRIKIEEEERKKVAKERERKEKELREKQAREASEKAKHETEKTVAKKNKREPVPAKPKVDGQIVYWLGGFVVLILGIIFLSSLNNLSSTSQPTPESAQTQALVITTPDNAELGATTTPSDLVVPTSPISEISHVLVDCLYEIRTGDSLYGIAQKFGIPDWKMIMCDPNPSNDCDLQPDKIRTGWMVIIPNVDEGVCSVNGGTPQEPSETSLPTEITDTKGVSMVLVPAGAFTMGSELDLPVHVEYLDFFYIDKFEVTNAIYKACVDDGICNPPEKSLSPGRPSYYRNSEYDNYPVTYVDWDKANIYCEWRGAQLPTEAQWEKAARGTDERIYPWGRKYDDNKANTSLYLTTPVGSYEDGKSPYGAYDMAGNVIEWVADWYSEADMEEYRSRNWRVPTTGQYHILRGGSFLDGHNWARTTFRWGAFSYEGPTYDYFPSSVGFRCASSTLP